MSILRTLRQAFLGPARLKEVTTVKRKAKKKSSKKKC